MRLQMGADPTNPAFAVVVSPEELVAMQGLPAAAEATEALVESRDLIVGHDPEREVSEFKFLLRRICRRPEETREASLRSVIELLDAFSQSQAEEPEDARLKWVIPGSAASPKSDRLGLQVKVRWPEVPEECVSDTATCAMRAMGRELRYGNLKAVRKLGYAKQVQALVDRRGAGGPEGVILRTDLKTDASLRTDGSAYEADRPDFVLTARNLRGHKQQIIGLTGAAAIAYADEFRKI